MTTIYVKIIQCFVLILFLGSFSVHGQSPYSTAGDHFVFSIPEPAKYSPRHSSLNHLVITSAYDANCTISVSAIGFQQQVYVPAGEGREITLPLQAQAMALEIIQDTVVEITSDRPVSVAFKKGILKGGGMMTVWPTDFLGLEYRICSYRNSDRNRGACMVTITALCDSTPIEITPTDSSHSGNLLPGNTYKILLNAGQCFQFRNRGFYEQRRKTTELTGTLIRATGPADRKIAVSVAKFAYVSFTPSATGETLYEMMMPKRHSDSLYYDVPMPWHVLYRFRVMAWENQTDVYVNNQLVANLQAGEYHQFDDSSAVKIHSNKNIQVFRLIHTNPMDTQYLCDPELTQLEPASQRVKKAVVYPQYRYFMHYQTIPKFKNGLQLICPAGHEKDLTINGVNRSADFQPFPADNGYVYATIQTDTNFQVIECEKGFYGQFNISVSQGTEICYLGGGSDYDGYYLPNEPIDTQEVCQYPLNISAHGVGDFYLWNDGSTGSTTQVNRPGIYWVTKGFVGACDTLFDVDSIRIDSIQLRGMNVNDSALCAGDSTWVNGLGPFDTLIWKDNWAQRSRYLYSGQVYHYEVEREGCTYQDSIVMDELEVPQFELPDQWILCNDRPKANWTGSSRPDYTYAWTPSHRFSDPTAAYPEIIPGSEFEGRLKVTASGGCFSEDSMIIQAHVMDTSGAIEQFEESDCQGSTVFLDVKGLSEADSITWLIDGQTYSGDSWTSSSVGYSPLTGQLIVQYAGTCTDTLPFSYEVTGNDGLWKLVNAFTPDGDGINDWFHPISNPEFRACSEFVVYNRWGNWCSNPAKLVRSGMDL
ncbi:hypothetical protein KFE98_15555 [bacterium SCSIO 12741]|nr:hypothetical protein KFE98_15555 [bacterium SCSIO 12741]